MHALKFLLAVQSPELRGKLGAVGVTSE